MSRFSDFWLETAAIQANSQRMFEVEEIEPEGDDELKEKE